MTTFDDREKAAENKYAHDKELDFKIRARRDHLFGLWAAQKLGLTGNDAESYAQTIIEADLAKSGGEASFAKVKADLAVADIAITDHDLKVELHHQHEAARKHFFVE